MMGMLRAFLQFVAAMPEALRQIHRSTRFLAGLVVALLSTFVVGWGAESQNMIVLSMGLVTLTAGSWFAISKFWNLPSS
jgi:hypothetical protein